LHLSVYPSNGYDRSIPQLMIFNKDNQQVAYHVSPIKEEGNTYMKCRVNVGTYDFGLRPKNKSYYEHYEPFHCSLLKYNTEIFDYYRTLELCLVFAGSQFDMYLYADIISRATGYEYMKTLILLDKTKSL